MLDYAAATLELTGAWLVGSKRRIGFVLNAAGCLIWIEVALRVELYGLLLVVVPALVINMRNWWRWR